MLQTEFLLGQRVGVVNARDAKEWLRALPVTDVRAAHHSLAALLAELEERNAPPRDRLEVLETLRAATVSIDLQYGQRYAAKPLPLGPAERNAFNHASALWARLEAAYIGLAQAALAGAEGMKEHLALCLARAVDWSARGMIGRIRGNQAEPHHALDAPQRVVELALKHAVMEHPVRDSQHPKGGTSVGGTYRRLLLNRLVSHVAQGREREAAFELAAAWENKVIASWLPASLARPLESRDLPYSEDPTRQRIKIVIAGQWMHMLDVTMVAKSLRRRIQKLETGEKPENLRLPDSFHHAGVSDLLNRIKRAWTEEASGRALPRRAVPKGVSGQSRGVSVCAGAPDFDAMYCMVGGHAFETSDRDLTLDRKRADEMFTFGHLARSRDEARASEARSHFEDWDAIDEGPGGMQLRRPRPGSRLRRGQLLCVRISANGDGLRLAEARWLTEPVTRDSAQGEINVGIEYLEGMPQAVAVRTTGINAQRQYVSGFLLMAQGKPMRMVLPSGWFKPQRIVEVRAGSGGEGRNKGYMQVALLKRGTDFEVIEVVPQALH